MIGISIPEHRAKLVWEGLFRSAWIEEAYLLLAEDWERGGKETFVELHLLVKMIGEWDHISGKLFPAFTLPPGREFITDCIKFFPLSLSGCFAYLRRGLGKLRR